MNPVVHFEMPFEDRDRMAKFYETSFGWKPQMLGPEMSNYVLVQTAETNPYTNMIKFPGSINGGFHQKTDVAPHPSLVIAVTDIHEAMKKLKEAGGKIIEGETKGEPVMIPGIGWYVSFFDTEGNRVSLLEPTQGM